MMMSVTKFRGSSLHRRPSGTMGTRRHQCASYRVCLCLKAVQMPRDGYQKSLLRHVSLGYSVIPRSIHVFIYFYTARRVSACFAHAIPIRYQRYTEKLNRVLESLLNVCVVLFSSLCAPRKINKAIVLYKKATFNKNARDNIST